MEETRTRKRIRAAAEGKVEALCDSYYEQYLAHLKALVSLRSVTSDEEALEKAMRHCRLIFSRALCHLGWDVGMDAADNLRCVPPVIDTTRPVLWMNAPYRKCRLSAT